MDLEWHIRLVDRLIKNSDGNARIKDYWNIIEQNDKSEEGLELLKTDEKILIEKTVKTINSRK